MANASGLGRVALPAPFKIPGFTGFWLSASSGSFARVVTQLALSWVTLEATGSPFLVGVVMAARSVPQLVMGIPAGALADGLDRRRIILGTNAATTLLLLVLVGLTTGGALPTAALIGVSLVFGVLDTVRMAATQAYAFDLVRASRATSGMALTNFGTQLLSMVGGLAGGYMLQQFGSSATFGVTALAVLIAIVVLVQARPAAALTVSGESTTGEATPSAGLAATDDSSSRESPSRQSGVHRVARPARRSVNVGRALTLLARNRLLAILSVAILVAEIFGFASQTLLPTFARDVFDVGAAGLGLMTAVRSAGGALGLLALSRIGAEGRAGLVFVCGAGAFGMALLLFALSPVYALALVMLGISGMCASVMDTLGQTLIQRNADEHERGAAMGIWVFSVGFGPVGHLTLGALATEFGAPTTQAGSGIMLMLAAGLMWVHAPLRRAR